MKQKTLVYALVSLAFAAAGCASTAASVPPADASNSGQACVAAGAYVVTTDTVSRASASRGPETQVRNVDSLVLQGRGVPPTLVSSAPARAVARTEFSRGGGVACD